MNLRSEEGKDDCATELNPGDWECRGAIKGNTHMHETTQQNGRKSDFCL